MKYVTTKIVLVIAVLFSNPALASDEMILLKFQCHGQTQFKLRYSNSEKWTGTVKVYVPTSTVYENCAIVWSKNGLHPINLTCHNMANGRQFELDFNKNKPADSILGSFSPKIYTETLKSDGNNGKYWHETITKLSPFYCNFKPTL